MTPASLQKYVDDRLAQLPRQDLTPVQPQFDALLGYWYMEVLTGTTVTGSSDHTSTWEDTSNARNTSLIATMGGWFPAQIVGGADRPARLRIGIWNDGPPYEVDVSLDGDTFGHLQVTVNGDFNDYTANQSSLKWKFRNGPNEVQIIICDGLERVTFGGNLWDGFYSKWMPVGWAQFGGSGGANGSGGGGGAGPVPGAEASGGV